jgi:hypothetical protein
VNATQSGPLRPPRRLERHSADVSVDAHTLDATGVLRRLRVDDALGLDEAEATHRSRAAGRNAPWTTWRSVSVRCETCSGSRWLYRRHGRLRWAWLPCHWC